MLSEFVDYKSPKSGARDAVIHSVRNVCGLQQSSLSRSNQIALNARRGHTTSQSNFAPMASAYVSSTVASALQTPILSLLNIIKQFIHSITRASFSPAYELYVDQQRHCGSNLFSCQRQRLNGNNGKHLETISNLVNQKNQLTIKTLSPVPTSFANFPMAALCLSLDISNSRQPFLPSLRIDLKAQESRGETTPGSADSTMICEIYSTPSFCYFVIESRPCRSRTTSEETTKPSRSIWEAEADISDSNNNRNEGKNFCPTNLHIEYSGSVHDKQLSPKSQVLMTMSHQRSYSECSDENFIIFLDSDGEGNSEDEDEVQISKPVDMTRQVSDRKKVRFNLKPKIHEMRTWSFAYRSARKCYWEQVGRDRSRFQERIQRTAVILDPILISAHRNVIYKSRFDNKD